MKKLIIFILIFSLVFCMAACDKRPSDTTAGTSTDSSSTSESIATGTAADAPLRRLGPSYFEDVFAYYRERYGKTEASGKALDIPVYEEENLLFYPLNKFSLDDLTEYFLVNPSAGDYYLALDLLHELPAELRVRADGSSYAAYDTDTGYRIYVMFNNIIITGYPIAIKKGNLLSRADFADIQVGDPFEKVEAIDDVAALWKKTRFTYTGDIQTLDNATFDSIHYLTDGILKIQYRISASDHTQITVIGKVYYEDYVITTANGESIDHKICDIDLPNTPDADTTGKTPLRRVGHYYEPEGFSNYLAYHGTTEESGKPLDIPVYQESEVLYHERNGFFIGRDTTLDNTEYFTYALYTLYELPTQLRVRADGSSYAVYDTDTGYRFYLFFHKSDAHLSGFPIVISKNQILSYADFADIQVGDTIQEVKAIDDIANIYIKQINVSDWDFPWTNIPIERSILEGDPVSVSTIHYLTDGILKIDYSVSGDYYRPSVSMIITDISFYEDYVVPTADGAMTSHKIKDIDLPTA